MVGILGNNGAEPTCSSSCERTWHFPSECATSKKPRSPSLTTSAWRSSITTIGDDRPRSLTRLGQPAEKNFPSLSGYYEKFWEGRASTGSSDTVSYAARIIYEESSSRMWWGFTNESTGHSPCAKKEIDSRTKPQHRSSFVCPYDCRSMLVRFLTPYFIVARRSSEWRARHLADCARF